MKNKYFNPIEFPELDRPKEKREEPPIATEITGDITEKLKTVRAEIAKMKAGTSNIRPGAIAFPKNKSPVLSALEGLEEAPTSRNALWNFIAVAKQDLGVAAAMFLVDLFIDVDPALERLK